MKNALCVKIALDRTYSAPEHLPDACPRLDVFAHNLRITYANCMPKKLCRNFFTPPQMLVQNIHIRNFSHIPFVVIDHNKEIYKVICPLGK